MACRLRDDAAGALGLRERSYRAKIVIFTCNPVSAKSKDGPVFGRVHGGLRRWIEPRRVPVFLQVLVPNTNASGGWYIPMGKYVRVRV